MSILIIYPQLDKPSTGGQFYDFAFLQQLKSIKKDCCVTLVDKDLGAGNSFLYMLKYVKKIRWISDFDIIISNSRLYPRLLLLFLLLKFFYTKKRTVVFHHHFNYMTQKGFKRYIHKFLELSFLKTVDTVIIPSPYIRDLMIKYCPNIKIEYLEIAFNHKDNINNRVKRKGNRLLFVGSVEPRKGVEYLVDMVDYLVANGFYFHLTIVGGISSQSYYQFLISKLNKKRLNEYVTFTGRISESHLEELFVESDIFTFPSLHEGYGMVLIEAMSYGLPVVAFSNSAMPYTVKNMKNGLLAENMNLADFSSKVLLLLKDQKLLKYLSQGAFETYVKSRTTDVLNEEISLFVNRLCEKKE